MTVPADPRSKGAGDGGRRGGGAALTILDEFGGVPVLPAEEAGAFGAPLVDQLGGSPSALAVGDMDGAGGAPAQRWGQLPQSCAR